MPTKASRSSVPAKSDKKFPETLSSLLLPPCKQRSTGPEPPSAKSQTSASLKEAAKTPNATSQKLDSSNKKKAAATISVPQLDAMASLVVNPSVPAPAVSAPNPIKVENSSGVSSIAPLSTAPTSDLASRANVGLVAVAETDDETFEAELPHVGQPSAELSSAPTQAAESSSPIKGKSKVAAESSSPFPKGATQPSAITSEPQVRSQSSKKISSQTAPTPATPQLAPATKSIGKAATPETAESQEAFELPDTGLQNKQPATIIPSASPVSSPGEGLVATSPNSAVSPAQVNVQPTVAPTDSRQVPSVAPASSTPTVSSDREQLNSVAKTLNVTSIRSNASTPSDDFSPTSSSRSTLSSNDSIAQPTSVAPPGPDATPTALNVSAPTISPTSNPIETTQASTLNLNAPSITPASTSVPEVSPPLSNSSTAFHSDPIFDLVPTTQSDVSSISNKTLKSFVETGQYSPTPSPGATYTAIQSPTYSNASAPTPIDPAPSQFIATANEASLTVSKTSVSPLETQSAPISASDNFVSPTINNFVTPNVVPPTQTIAATPLKSPNESAQLATTVEAPATLSPAAVQIVGPIKPQDLSASPTPSQPSLAARVAPADPIVESDVQVSAPTQSPIINERSEVSNPVTAPLTNASPTKAAVQIDLPTTSNQQTSFSNAVTQQAIPGAAVAQPSEPAVDALSNFPDPQVQGLSISATPAVTAASSTPSSSEDSVSGQELTVQTAAIPNFADPKNSALQVAGPNVASNPTQSRQTFAAVTSMAENQTTAPAVVLENPPPANSSVARSGPAEPTTPVNATATKELSTASEMTNAPSTDEPSVKGSQTTKHAASSRSAATPAVAESTEKIPVAQTDSNRAVTAAPAPDSLDPQSATDTNSAPDVQPDSGTVTAATALNVSDKVAAANQTVPSPKASAVAPTIGKSSTPSVTTVTNTSGKGIATLGEFVDSVKAANPSGNAGSDHSSFSQQPGMAQTQISGAHPVATTQRVEAASSPSQIDKKALMTQVANRFDAVAASQAKNGVVVQLAPNALGTITITLKTVGKQIDTQIAASNTDVRTALEQSRPELAQTIQSRGYSLSNMTITQESDSSTTTSNSDRQKQGQNQNQGQPQNPQTAPQAPIFEYRPSLDTISHSSTRFKAFAGVDLWI